MGLLAFRTRDKREKCLNWTVLLNRPDNPPMSTPPAEADITLVGVSLAGISILALTGGSLAALQVWWHLHRREAPCHPHHRGSTCWVFK